MEGSDMRRRRARLLLERGPFCGICGRLILKREITVDHRIPICEGGTNRRENLDLAHYDCNWQKGRSMPAA